MDISMTAREIADAIAQAATEATGLRCETFTDGHGDAAIIAGHTSLIARVTPDRQRIQVVAAPFGPEAAATGIPGKATSLSGMRELAARLDDAIAHVTAAAEAAARQ